HVFYENKKGQTKEYSQKFPGFYSWISNWDNMGTYSDIRECPHCKGYKLKPQFLEVKIGSYHIGECHQLSLSELYDHLVKKTTVSTALHTPLISSHYKMIIQKLFFLGQLGLGYINLNRLGQTLSAGEAQRVKLASLLNSELTGITILLDEPTRGLHPSEVSSFIQLLQKLKEIGNTIIVIEHDPDLILAADRIIDLGPKGGTQGGEIQFTGTPNELLKTNNGKQTQTGQQLIHLQKIDFSNKSIHKINSYIEIKNACENNLKIDHLHIPLNMLTGICGVSGSGKSTLMIDTIGRYIAPKKITTSVAYTNITPGAFGSISGYPKQSIVVDQARSGMSSPLHYLNLKSVIEKLYLKEMAGIEILSDIFQEKCPHCLGKGYVQYNMSFLPDEKITCPDCNGFGYGPEALELKVRGLKISELFSKTIDEVYEIWQDKKDLQQKLQSLKDLQLGYLILNQKKISTGEAQRMKMAKEILKYKKGKNLLIILDEPSLGLHLADQKQLLQTFQTMVSWGCSIIMIEHNPYLLAHCDYLIELGPQGGKRGGKVIAADFIQNYIQQKTPTSPYIREYFP
ncbi:MAG: ATP-binding cassette domain-containing protein, partial [Spirochaetes bacterium]|nr:ATP-binding cassette domain-containing protein [Spirochaetota bacterium]